MEITATADSLILVYFKPENTADIAWMDRKTGTLGKQLQDIAMGAYRLGEFQLRLCPASPRLGDEPVLEEDKVLVTSVRPWGEGLYLLDLGVYAATDRATGVITDFTVPNEFAPQPFMLLDERAKRISPFNPDTVFNVGHKSWVEVWKTGATPVGVFVSTTDKSLVLVKAGTEASTLPFQSIEVDSLRLASFTKSESRGTLEANFTWGPWYDVPLDGDKFGVGTKRGAWNAPDGKTTWSFFQFGAIEFLDTLSGKRTVYADPVD